MITKKELKKIMKENEYCISVGELVKKHGCDDESDLLRSYGLGNRIPACCREGCEVEANAYCQHGCPSFLLAIGVRNLWKLLQ